MEAKWTTGGNGESETDTQRMKARLKFFKKFTYCPFFSSKGEEWPLSILRE